MAKITLVRAFTLRKRLRNIIDNIILELQHHGKTFISVSSTYPDGSVVESNEKPFEYHGYSLLETYNLLTVADNYMLIMNNLIDEYNATNARKIINELELEKDKVSMLRTLAENRKEFSESISTYQNSSDSANSCTGIMTKKYELVDNFDWISELDKCKKKIVLLEDSLSEVNSNTTFELNDEIIKFIKENI